MASASAVYLDHEEEAAFLEQSQPLQQTPLSSQLLEARATPAQPTFTFKEFQSEHGPRTVFYQYMLMKDSFLLWIGVGNQPPALDSLTIAMVSRLQGQGIPSNTLLGEGSSAGTELAQRLAKKTGCVVFVSLNVPSEILESLEQELELEIFQQIKDLGRWKR